MHGARGETDAVSTRRRDTKRKRVIIRPFRNDVDLGRCNIDADDGIRQRFTITSRREPEQVIADNNLSHMWACTRTLYEFATLTNGVRFHRASNGPSPFRRRRIPSRTMSAIPPRVAPKMTMRQLNQCRFCALNGHKNVVCQDTQFRQFSSFLVPLERPATGIALPPTLVLPAVVKLTKLLQKQGERRRR